MCCLGGKSVSLLRVCVWDLSVRIFGMMCFGVNPGGGGVVVGKMERFCMSVLGCRVCGV